MRPTGSRFAALVSSILLLLTAVEAARRPRFGGLLRMQTSARITSLDPASSQPDSMDESARRRILANVFETLVRLDDKGEAQPALAVSWVHDPARRQWVFTPRPNVLFHNGARWEPPPNSLAFDDKRPIGDILRSLATAQNAVVARGSDGTLSGTGPFRMAGWESGAVLKLEANADYWGGRPFLDAIEIRMARTKRDQSIDFEIGKSDVIELAVSEVRRVQQRGGKVAVTSPTEIVALVVESAPPGIERALSLAIDRNAIYNVLLQRTGVISGALLPYWLTGYSFVFPTAMDHPRAREMAGVKQPLTLAFDEQNPLMRAIAERIMLNAGDAGIPMRAAAGKGPAAVRLIAARFTSAEPAQALAEVASAFGAQAPIPSASDPDQLYAAENGVLASRRIVPLFHLPAAYQLSPQVHGWPARTASTDRWRLDDVWLDERSRQ